MALLCHTPQLGLSSKNFFGRRPCLPLTVRQTPVFVRCPTQAGIIGPGKDWESYKLNKNGKPIRVKMHVRMGDTVQLIAGSEKGKVGKIEKVFTKTGQVIVGGANIKYRHLGPQAEGESGQILEREAPIHHSNVMLYSEEQKVRSRVAYKHENGQKVRYLKKTGEVVPRYIPSSSSSDEEE